MLWLSASQIASYQKCRLQRDLRYEQKLYPKFKTARLQLGIAVHEALQRYYEFPQELRTEGVLSTYYETSFASEKEKLERAAKEEGVDAELDFYLAMENGRKIVKEYIELDSAELIQLPVIQTELDIRVEVVPNVWGIVGKLDGVLLQEPGGFILETKVQGKAAPEDLEDYDMQTPLYSWLIKQKYGLDIKDVVYNIIAMPTARMATRIFRHKSTKSQSEIDYVMGVAQGVAKSILDKEAVYPTFNRMCKFCDYERLCQAQRLSPSADLDWLKTTLYTPKTDVSEVEPADESPF